MDIKAKLIKFLKARFPDRSVGRWVLSGLFHHPFTFPIALGRSFFATKRLTGSFSPIKVRVNRGMRLRLKIHQESHVSLNGSLLAEDWGNESGRASLTVAQGAKLELKGDFAIGPEVHISVSRNAELVLGGRNLSSGSGITCRSRVMVEKKIHIGADSIIAWNVFISDSDWHDIEGQPRAIPVWIGNHVWVSHDVSVLKGAVVPNDCIIGAKSLVIQKEFPESCLIAGVPATVRRIGVKWQR